MTPSNEGNVLQSDFSDTPAIGLPGGVPTDGGWEAPGDTKIAEEAIGFGIAVSRGTEKERGIVKGGTQFCGITRAKQGQNILTQDTVDSYGEGDNVPVQIAGDIFVTVTTNVVAGNPGYYDSSTGALKTGSGTLIVGSEFMTNTLSGGVARLRLSQSAGNQTT